MASSLNGVYSVTSQHTNNSIFYYLIYSNPVKLATSRTGMLSFYGECSFLDDYKILAATHSEQFLGFKTVLEALKVWLIFSDFLCPWWSVAKHPNPGPDSNHWPKTRGPTWRTNVWPPLVRSRGYAGLGCQSPRGRVSLEMIFQIKFYYLLKMVLFKKLIAVIWSHVNLH